MDRELEYIRLKVDWYKSVFPWILAMVVGAVTFARAIDSKSGDATLTLVLLVGAIVLLLVALLATWFAALALIHRLEAPYRPGSRFLNALTWAPHGSKWEVVFGSVAGFCLGGGLTAFVLALVANATAR